MMSPFLSGSCRLIWSWSVAADEIRTVIDFRPSSNVPSPRVISTSPEELALTPPTPRRGLMLIDPSYEVKSDYDAIPKHLAHIHRKWNVGVLMLWYPLLGGSPHAAMLGALSVAFPEALRHEVRFAPARDGHRMHGSGMFVINPPYGLDTEAALLTERFRGL